MVGSGVLGLLLLAAGAPLAVAAGMLAWGRWPCCTLVLYYKRLPQ
jgi:hypothetical protein